jgi:hypothetical protein
VAKSKKFVRYAGVSQAARWSPGDAEINSEFGVEECGPEGKRWGRVAKSDGRAVVHPGEWLVIDDNGKLLVLTHDEFRKAHVTPAD